MEQLWQHLAGRKLQYPFELAPRVRAFLWTQLVDYATEANAVKFFKLAAERELKPPAVQSVDDLPWLAFKYELPYVPISDMTTAVRGSCSSYHDRVDVTEDIREEQMDLDTAVEK